MRHALRHHNRIHTPEDPEFFRSMSEKLADILRQLQDKWDELERVLAEFIRTEVTRGRQEEIEGLDPKIHAPFFGTLKSRIDQQPGEPLQADANEFAGLVQLTTLLRPRRQAVLPLARHSPATTPHRVPRAARTLPPAPPRPQPRLLPTHPPSRPQLPKPRPLAASTR
jgi:hypothetical protein